MAELKRTSRLKQEFKFKSAKNILYFIKKYVFLQALRTKGIFFVIRQRWSCGRVARLSSAKAATAVRIRFRPQPTQSPATIVVGLLLFTTR